VLVAGLFTGSKREMDALLGAVGMARYCWPINAAVRPELTLQFTLST
jgi:hypothetical protein